MSRLLPWVRLISGLKYSAFFLVVLIALPLSAFAWMPLYSTLGGVFLELEPWDVFWISLAFFAAWWSLMVTTGLLADGLEKRRPEIGSENYLPPSAARFLSIPITAAQMLVFSALALAQAAIVVAMSRSGSTSALAALGGALAAYLVTIVLAVPAHLAIPGFSPIPRWRLVAVIWRWFHPLRPAAVWLHRLLSRVFGAARLNAALEPDSETPQLKSGHFFAVTTASGILVLLAVVGWVFFPPAERLPVGPPSGAYIYTLLLLVIWLISGLDFHLSRLRISPVLVVLLIMLVVYTVTNADYFYDAEPAKGGTPAVTPVDVARDSRAPKNLVVVASSGGGILASGWTTLLLRQMVADRPEIADEIRLVSGVSGGSVGAAYYAHALRSLSDAERNPAGFAEALDRAFRDSVASSLDATAYGLALLDFERIFLGNSLPVLRTWNRGRLLESSWARIAGDDPTLLDLRPDVAAGRVPALILNATVMERGHRTMLTPIDFRGVTGKRANTQTDLLGAGEGEVDLGLWTAARLSATFPYVSPAARSDLPAQGDGEASANRAYHLVDGGYYENFGITSSFDFLWPVLEARLDAANGLEFDKVLILQLNAFPPGDPPAPTKGLPAALAGPFLTLVALRNGTQITRNGIDVERSLASWQARFDRAEGVSVCLASIEVRPPKGTPEGPLSWHLTPKQIAALEKSWDTVVPIWSEIKSFLDRPCVR